MHTDTDVKSLLQLISTALVAQGVVEDVNAARLDAEVLLAHVLDWPRTRLITAADHRPDAATRQHLSRLLARRLDGVPLPYLTAAAEFWSLPLTVNEHVLVPRPETELLVETALNALHGDELPAGLLIDAGTGSGAIALALAREQSRPVLALELSTAALEVAKSNAERLRDRLRAPLEFARANWLEAIADHSVALLLSNPPYLAEQDEHLRGGALQHEPRMALASGPEGLDAITAIARDLPRVLKPGALALIEHGQAQGEVVRLLILDAFAATAGRAEAEVDTLPDLAGHDRVCRIRIAR